MMVALHQARQRIQKGLRTIQGIHMELRLVVRKLVIGIQHNRGNVTAEPFSANAAAVRDRHGVSDHNGTNVAVPQDLERSLNGSHRYDPVARMC
jgi:hypothetical protein